jgi:uncharacterized membrane-anchored protein YhcB (DUF1043 family)
MSEQSWVWEKHVATLFARRSGVPLVYSRLASIVLVICGAFILPLVAQSTSARAQQSADQNCEKVKRDIEQLQQDLANLSAEMQDLTNDLNRVNQDISQIQEDLKTATAASASIGGKLLGGFEEQRGQILDSLAKAMGLRKQMKQQLEDDADLMQAIKEEIADLLNKLANCAPPSSIQPPREEPPAGQPTPPAKPTPSKSQTSMSTTGAGIQFQLRGFGGATIINGNSPSTAGFDGAVLFPLGNRVLVGPTAGFQWVNSSIISSIGSMTAGSTFANQSVGFKEGNFGGQIALNLSGWELGIRGGATVASSKITQATGFCGTVGPTAPPTCTVTGSTTTHDTVTGPFVGGYISHSIFSHVGVFVEFDYSRFKDTKPNPTNPTGPSVSVFDLHNNAAVAGLVLSFGRHSAK